VNVNKSITAVFYHTKLTVCSAEMRSILYCIDVTLLMCGKWNTIAVCKCIFCMYIFILSNKPQILHAELFTNFKDIYKAVIF